jgi:poly-gamma-glutamate synthesis protein (capsule biosynthesis protein)
MDHRDSSERRWPPIPRVLLPGAPRPDLGRHLGGGDLERHAAESRDHELAFADELAKARYPFLGMADELRAADVTFLNLEMPLSAGARRYGEFLGSPAFAEALRWAGVDLVSVANNHTFDGGDVGLADTLTALSAAGLGAVGAGHDLATARMPLIVERAAGRLGFLAYNQILGAIGSTAFALPGRSGVAALSPDLVVADIERLRRHVDVVVVSCHWGEENSGEVHPAARRLAHEFLDAGADVILGHHPHLPQGVEARARKVVFYSLGNFAFGHWHDYWDDNVMARIHVARGRVSDVEVLPISGRGADVAQPRVLVGPRARRLLEVIRARSRELDTEMTIAGGVGRVRIR